MFDSVEELLRKVRLGEDTSLELKSLRFRGAVVSDPRREKLADEIAAMANTADCVLVLGVDDKTREILGIPRGLLENAERLIFEICNDTIKPPVAFRSYRMELPDSGGSLQAVLRIDIPRSLFVHRSPGGYFRRQGSSIREMLPEELARLFQQRSQARLVRFDEQPVPESDLSSLSEPLWLRFVGGEVSDPELTLRKLSLLTLDDAGAERATVAGVLLCATEPQRWLPGAFLQAVRYRGVDQDSNYQIDARDIQGPLDQQVHEAISFVKRNMSISATKQPRRRETPQFSLRAVFEAVVNAVAHRDYSVHGSKIRLFIFENRLELYSPGPLPNTLTVENMRLRQSTRNELITSLLAKCPIEDSDLVPGRSYLMEKRGDGVPIILKESTELSGRTPDYQLIDDSELLLTIWAAVPESS